MLHAGPYLHTHFSGIHRTLLSLSILLFFALPILVFDELKAEDVRNSGLELLPTKIRVLTEASEPRFETARVDLGSQDLRAKCSSHLLTEANEETLLALQRTRSQEIGSFISEFSKTIEHASDSHIWQFQESPGKFHVFAELPREGRWREIGFADLNADLRPDLISYGGRFQGWWVTFGSPYGGLSRSVSGLDFPSPDQSRYLLLDIDCDGSDDVVEIPTGSTKILTVAFSRFSNGVPGVLIRANTGESCTTDVQGECLFVGSNKSLRVEHPGLIIEEVSRRKGDTNVVQEVVAFMATRVSPDSKHQGQRFSLGPRGDGPYVCLGFNPGDPLSLWRRKASECPEGHALMGVSLPKDNSRWAQSSVPRWVCCPLPSDDILQAESALGQPDCPENTVAVGADPGWDCPSCPQRLICKKINTARYALGKVTAGVYWGAGRFRERNTNQVLRSDVPATFRFALGRTGLNTWDEDGCIGYPWGSLLTRMSDARSCDGANFRTLLRRSSQSSGEHPSTVQMFPDCQDIDDEKSPLGRCR